MRRPTLARSVMPITWSACQRSHDAPAPAILGWRSGDSGPRLPYRRPATHRAARAIL